MQDFVAGREEDGKTQRRPSADTKILEKGRETREKLRTISMIVCSAMLSGDMSFSPMYVLQIFFLSRPA